MIEYVFNVFYFTRGQGSSMTLEILVAMIWVLHRRTSPRNMQRIWQKRTAAKNGQLLWRRRSLKFVREKWLLISNTLSRR